MRSLNYKISTFWLCLWGLVAIGLSEQYVLNRDHEGHGVFEDQSYNDPIGEFTDYERRTYAYGASRNDDVMSDVSEDESENDDKDRQLKEWFLSKIDEHRKELTSSHTEVKKEAKTSKGESEEDREALRREEEQNEKKQEEKNEKKSHIPKPGELFEGDIIMTRHLRDHITNRDTAKRDAIKYKRYLWPKGPDGLIRVPYEVNENFNDEKRESLARAVHDFKKYTCIRFEPKKSDDEDCVHFFSKKSMCYSSVGRQGGDKSKREGKGEKGVCQRISIGDGCERKGTVIHEMLHSIGFIHEQSRPDRDQFVQVKWENIKPDLKHNFEKYDPYLVTNLGVRYDFDSVLHYHNRAFTKNGEETLVDKLEPKRQFGQRESFSKRNIEQVNALYDCDVDPSVMDDIKYE